MLLAHISIDVINGEFVLMVRAVGVTRGERREETFSVPITVPQLRSMLGVGGWSTDTLKSALGNIITTKYADVATNRIIVIAPQMFLLT